MFKFIEETMLTPYSSMNSWLMILGIVITGFIIFTLWCGPVYTFLSRFVKLPGEIADTSIRDGFLMGSWFYYAGLALLVSSGFAFDDVIWLISDGAYFEYPEGQYWPVMLTVFSIWSCMGLLTIRLSYLIFMGGPIHGIAAFLYELPVIAFFYATGLFIGPLYLIMAITKTFEGRVHANILNTVFLLVIMSRGAYFKIIDLPYAISQRFFNKRY